MKKLSVLLVALVAFPCLVHAQKLVEKRDQATGWYVPVKFMVTAQRTKAKAVSVQVFLDNKLIQELPAPKGKFTLALDLDKQYTVVLAKEGYRSKSVYIDTSIPSQLVQYPAYECTMNLDPADQYTHSDPFYLDFPSAIVRWNDEAHGFLPEMEYLKDIQAKMAMLQVQADPR